MKKKLIGLLSALAMGVGGSFVAAAPAQAAGTCSMIVPSRVYMNTPYRGITVRLGSNCTAAGVTSANWDGYHPTQGIQEILFFDNGRTTDTWDLYDWDPIGRWQWRPEGAYDANFNVVSQYGPYYTDVRLASYGRVTATRSGSRVTVATTAGRYWPQGDTWVRWAGARGQIQYRTPGTTTWRGLKEVYSNSNGAYSYTYTTSAVRDYRLVLYANAAIWDSISPVVRR